MRKYINYVFGVRSAIDSGLFFLNKKYLNIKTRKGLMVCLFGLILYVPVDKFSVMLGRVFLVLCKYNCVTLKDTTQ